LLRTYKATKDNKKKTGRGRTRFLFYEQLDLLLGDTPTNSSPQSIDVSVLDQNEITEDPVGSATSAVNVQTSSSSFDIVTSEESALSKRKRRNPATEYINFKTDYY
jgi:hypothetical protein